MSLPKTEPLVIYIPDGSGGLNRAIIDGCLTEQHTLTNTLTDNPVEQGAPITDHSRPEPRRVTLECITSNTPAKRTPDNYASMAWQQWVDLWQNPRLIDVATVRDHYRNMGVENVSSPVDVKSANALRFTVSLKQVRLVQSRRTRIVVAKDPRAQQKVKQGAQTPKEPDKEPSSLANSLGESASRLKDSDNPVLRGLGNYASDIVSGPGGL